MNSDLARAFERIADLLEITGADTFRVNSYRRVARTISDLSTEVHVLHEAGKLRELKGIGKSTAAKIEEYLETGRIGLLEELKEKVPAGLPALLGIPGMGPKKVALIHQRLGVKGLDDLKQAIGDGRLDTLPGFGAKSVKRISDGIRFLEASGERVPMGLALPIARELAESLRTLEGVERVEVAGSLRRGRETVGDIDLLCICAEGEEVVQTFVSSPRATRVLASGVTKGSITVAVRDEQELQVDLRVVPAESFGAAWQYFTGSKEHNVRLRELAGRKGWKLNEWGLFDGDKAVAGATEEEIYAALGLPWVPPEVREDRGELEADADLDDLVDMDDLRGDLHMHTRASDGKNSIEEMAAAAKERGCAYIAITDHSRSSTIANGLSIERLRKHIAAVREADRRIKGIAVLSGCECDILPDGRLDYPDEVLAECDVVVASVHAAMTGGKATPTERTLAAIANPYVHIVGHPSGRLIQERPAMDIDMERIAEAAAGAGVALEVNASWQRLDLKDAHVRIAIEVGARIAINTDAHRTTGLVTIELGVVTARRGYAHRKHVVNAMTLAALRKWLARRRPS